MYLAGVPIDSHVASGGRVRRVLQGLPGWTASTEVHAHGWAWTSDGLTVAWWPRPMASNADCDTLYFTSVVEENTVLAVPLPRQEGTARGNGQLEAPRITGRWATTLSWTPDGSRALVLVDGGLWLVPRRGMGPRFLDSGDSHVVQHVLSVSNRDALVATIDRLTGQSGLFWVGLASHHWRRAAEYDRSPPTAITASRGGTSTVVAYVASTDTSPSNVYTATLSGAAGTRVQSRQLTHATIDVRLPAVRDTLVSFPVAPSVTATALLVRPASANGPLPTIVYAYPGEFAASLWAHRLKADFGIVDVLMAAERGYAVLYADVPLPPRGAYGRSGPTAAMVDGMKAAIAAAAQTGWVDTTRLGVIGHSYGGTMVNVLVTHMPEQFRAAVSMSGVSNFVSSVYGASVHGPDWWVTAQGRMAVPFREQPERYVVNSPIRYLEKVTTPLLLIHGKQDGIVSVSQSEEMFRGLVQLGKSVELVRYREADHGDDKFFGAAWSRALEWFEKFLLPQAPH